MLTEKENKKMDDKAAPEKVEDKLRSEILSLSEEECGQLLQIIKSELKPIY